MLKPICLNCGSNESHEFFRLADISEQIHTLYKCSSCGLVFLNPLPSNAEIDKMYSPEYYGKGETEKFKASMVVRMIAFFSRKRAKRLSVHLKTGARVMDVGCGNGRFLEHLHSFNSTFELHGIEIQANAALRASQRLEGRAWIHTVTGLERFFGKNAFDAISFIHVFEHLPEPARTMDELAVVIRPGGIVMIVIPNIMSVQAQRHKHNWFHLDPPRHIHFYPPEVLKNELQKRGFALLSERYHDIEQNPYGSVQSILNAFLKKRDVLFERLKGNKKYAPTYGWFRILFMKLFWFGMFPLCVFSDRIAALRRKGATVEFIFRKSQTEDRKK